MAIRKKSGCLVAADCHIEGARRHLGHGDIQTERRVLWRQEAAR
jgi:hypothetical protein